MNKLKIYSPVLILLLYLSCQTKESDTSIDNTKIEIPKKRFNFDSMSLQDSLTFVLRIKNKSSTPLYITKVGASCGCTTSKFTKDSVPFDQYAEVEIQFKPNQIGPIEKSIVVETNTDPPFNVFYIKGNVIE